MQIDITTHMVYMSKCAALWASNCFMLVSLPGEGMKVLYNVFMLGHVRPSDLYILSDQNNKFSNTSFCNEKDQSGFRISCCVTPDY